MADTYEDLDAAERWYSDSFRVWEPPGFLQVVEVDMSRSRELLAKMRATGLQATYTHLFVRATALALARHPQLHLGVTRRRRYYPQNVDICLPVAGRSVFAASKLIIADAGQKSLPEIVREISDRAPQVKGQEPPDFAALRRQPALWGALRRWVLRSLWDRFDFRTRNAGTFTVTCLPDVDLFASFTFVTAAAVGFGQVRERVIPVAGVPAVRPTVFAACAVDHKAWDGVRAATFLNTLRSILADGELLNEVPH